MNLGLIIVQLCVLSRVGFQPQKADTAEQRFGVLKTISTYGPVFDLKGHTLHNMLLFKGIMVCNVWFVCLLTSDRIHGFRIQDLGFRNRAVKQSLTTRGLILGYRQSKNIPL